MQKHFTAGLFSAEIPYRWLFSVETLYCLVISYSMFFNRADVSAVRIVHEPFLSVSI